MENTKMLPEKFVARLKDFIPQEFLRQTVSAFSIERPVSLRANTLKLSASKLYKDLSSHGFVLEKVAWYKDAFILKNKSKDELLQTQEYQKGELYIQNLSSMIPPLVLSPHTNDTVLDMTAAPGSKTSQIAAIMENQGTILANDKSRQRLFKLKDVLGSQGVRNTQITSYPGEFLWRKYTGYFDKVLLDAPCSMEGRISSLDPESYKDWSVKKIKHLSQLQKWLLRSAIACTKPGGTIVYSTCSLSPEENEEVIDWALSKEVGKVTIEEIPFQGISFSQGLTKFGNKQFNSSLSKTIRIYPDAIFEGFYIAALRRI